jgi:hypothetical protein
MSKNILNFLFVLIFTSCINESFKYPNDLSVSNISGKPHDSLTFYFPSSIQYGNKTTLTKIDTFEQNWYSSALYSAKEPILFNSYLGHDIYRFLWLRSFHKPVVFSIHKKDDKVWLVTKELDKQPEFYVLKVVSIEYDDTTEMNKENIDTSENNIIADRMAEIVLNQKRDLSINEWNRFVTLIDDCSFWTATPSQTREGLDGSEWIFEGHLKNKYWFVNRWSPEGKFKKLGVFLIEKSGLQEKIY